MAVPAVGVFLPTMTGAGGALPDVAAAARHVEQLGLESAWVVDQLVGGTGVPLLDSTVALGVAAAVTRRVRLGFGVLILPLRPVSWTAKQVASLQHVSGNRVLLGVGVGGDRHDRSWAAAGVPRRERGRRTDAALAVLGDLIAGRPAELGGGAVRLAPGAEVPPVIVGGMASAALERVAAYGDGWFAMPLPDQRLAATAARPATTTCFMTAGTAITAQPDPNSQIVGYASNGDMIYWYGYSSGYTYGQDAVNGTTGWIPGDDMTCIIKLITGAGPRARHSAPAPVHDGFRVTIQEVRPPVSPRGIPRRRRRRPTRVSGAPRRPPTRGMCGHRAAAPK